MSEGRMTAEQTPDIYPLVTVLQDVKRGRCLNCLRMQATDDDWANTKEGERPDLCWEPNVYSCGWVAETTLVELEAQALAPVLAAAVREAEMRVLREAAEAGREFLGDKTFLAWDYIEHRADRIKEQA